MADPEQVKVEGKEAIAQHHASSFLRVKKDEPQDATITKKARGAIE